MLPCPADRNGRHWTRMELSTIDPAQVRASSRQMWSRRGPVVRQAAAYLVRFGCPLGGFKFMEFQCVCTSVSTLSWGYILSRQQLRDAREQSQQIATVFETNKARHILHVGGGGGRRLPAPRHTPRAHAPPPAPTTTNHVAAPDDTRVIRSPTVAWGLFENVVPSVPGAVDVTAVPPLAPITYP